MLTNQLIFGADNDVWAVDMIDARTGAFITSASVACSVYDTDGTLVVTISMALYAAGAGSIHLNPEETIDYAGAAYVGEIPAGTGLELGASYRCVITATVGGNTGRNVQNPIVVDAVG